ncbi:MAG: nucleotidyltransferase [Acidobacteria bacterium]|nr:nucleotidyltransferase [Acidobacteriota bacterium]
MKRTLQALNQMVNDGVIEGYVIGGAVAASYYLEPIATNDLDVFFQLAVSASGLISLSPLYAYLRGKGYEAEAGAVNIEGWPVQFLPVFNPLYEEAYEKANQISFDGVPVRTLTAEHLVAVALQTGRPKDHVRIIQFLEAETIKLTKLQRIIERHGLRFQWTEFLERHQLRANSGRSAGRPRRKS